MINSDCVRQKQQGFTLIEMVLVIVILGIIALGSTVFIINTAKGLQDVNRRATLANSLRNSIERINIQLQHSLAGSVRVTAQATSSHPYQCLEMMPIRATAFYRELADSPSSELTTVLLSQQALGLRAILPAANSTHFFRDFFARSHATISAKILKQTPIATHVTQLLFAHPSFGNAQTNLLLAKNKDKHNQQLRLISQPVSYCLEEGNLYRYSDYPLQRQQRTPKNLPSREPKRLLLAQGLAGDSRFSLQQQTQQLTVTLKAVSQTEELSLTQTLWLPHD